MIEIKIDDSSLKYGLGKLLKNATATRPMMASIATELSSLTEDNFADEAWGGRKWKSSAAAKARQGRALQDSGQLAASINTKVGNDFAKIGTNKAYAAIHQFGGKTSAHKIVPKKKKALAFGGIVRKSVNHPGSTIPARPFLPIDENGNLQNGAEESILDIALIALQKGL